MRVGIVGHIDLGSSETEQWVRKSLFEWVNSNPLACGISNLAPGADMIFADICRQQEIPLEVVLPCEDYGNNLDPGLKEQWKWLLAGAESQIALDADCGEDAYLAAAQILVDRCEVLLAVWNGEPAKGKGGTGDGVAYALKAGKNVVHFHTRQHSIVYL